MFCRRRAVTAVMFCRRRAVTAVMFCRRRAVTAVMFCRRRAVTAVLLESRGVALRTRERMYWYPLHATTLPNVSIH
jgi:hypothetical protein